MEENIVEYMASFPSDPSQKGGPQHEDELEAHSRTRFPYLPEFELTIGWAGSRSKAFELFGGFGSVA